jgi:hypothetical protein
VPRGDDVSRVRSPVEIETAAKHVICEIIPLRNRAEHFANVRSFGTHVRNVIETSARIC